ncbi:hypothetical protein SynBIOSE41_01990 [Synechococcus sp. BIOS-E4-1]|uniref:hypothetical protein n=1 Tax=Synechococcus sp. BIOS-E4-1 TaxID=1400864 RepID=UPI001645BC8A|nr:hypothetical protein [Synechococcus sp. BIOS-E4-1]QNI54496.1 hypothetical protein SynBIOSE41_01990 [Synechococcus sp. BIOS-E4-1]
MAPSRRSYGLFPNTASTDDEAGLLTTSFQPIVGLQSAKTAQINIVATFAADTDEVIIQVQKGGVTKNLTYGWGDFRGPSNPSFFPGEYRLAACTRGYGITAARVGLSSTATDIRADFSAVC